MEANRSRKLSLALIVASYAFTVWMYPRLPERVPIHWGWSGDADGFASRAFGAFLLPGTALLVFALFEALAFLFPRASAADAFRPTYHRLQLAVTGFMACMSFFVLAAQAGSPIAMNRAVGVSVGVLFVFIGDLLPKIPPNQLAGIRTPWTLRDPDVWLRTHRMAGPVFMTGGALVAFAAWFGASAPVYVALLIAPALIPCVYSYVISPPHS